MTLSTAEIESIVRRVLSTLVAGDAIAQCTANRAYDSRAAVRQITDAVVSVSLLRGPLDGIQRIEILPNAIVTPAVRDLCRERKIAIVRSSTPITASANRPLMANLPSNAAVDSTRPQRLLVAGNTSWIDGVAKQLCSQQARIAERSSDDASALRTISDGLRAGHQAAIAIVRAPHAACWQAARDDKLRPAVVSQWSDLALVLFEVPVNVLIVSDKTWNIPSVCNLARRLFEHLQRNS